MIDLLKLPFSLSSQQGKRIELWNISAVGFPREGVTLFGKRIRGRPPQKKKIKKKKHPKFKNGLLRNERSFFFPYQNRFRTPLPHIREEMRARICV